MAATIVTLAGEILSQLLAQSAVGGFNQSFLPVLAFVPLYSLQDMDTLHVTVLPRGSTGLKVDRGKNIIEELSVDIAVQKRLPGLDFALFQNMLELTEQLRDYLIVNPPSGFTVVGWTTDPIYDPQAAFELRQFTGVLTVTYKQGRTLA